MWLSHTADVPPFFVVQFETRSSERAINHSGFVLFVRFRELKTIDKHQRRPTTDDDDDSGSIPRRQKIPALTNSIRRTVFKLRPQLYAPN